MSMLNSEQIHAELNKLNLILEPGRNHPSYAYEHPLDQEKFLYVKRKKDTPINKAPLVLYPESITLRSLIDRIAGLEVTWNKTKSTSYRRNPKDNGTSQYGYDANVSTSKALYDLISVLTGSAPTCKATAIDASLLVSGKKDVPVNSLNQILYGPPGTGKTYATTEMAVKIAEPQWYQDTCAALVGTEQPTLELRHAIKEKYDELVKARRIDFTTFHQSYSYEDFLEGIRADSDDGKLSYSVAEGVFKRLALAASRSTLDQNHLGLKNEPRIWKISIGERNEVQFRQKCIERSEARIGWNKTGDLAIELDARDEDMQQYWESLSGKTQTTLNYFQQGIEVGDVLLCLKDHTSALAIGIVTSEYRYEPNDACAGYNHVRDVNWILSDINLDILPLNNNTTLVAQTVYSLDRMTWIDILAELSQQQITLPPTLSVPYQDSEAPNYVLIIDEINRGNISRIFGELITLLEPDKRKGGSDTRSVILPYSKEPFYVPDNLYVIGTMNTADKSLAQLDLALRRRFSFVEMLPQAELLKNVEVFDVNVAQMLTKINQRIEVLLDAEHLIGHSYFMPLLSIDDEVERQAELAKLFENKLLPLLQEYFFDDYQRIGWVLNVPKPGEHPDEHYFILTDKAQNKSLPKLDELFAANVAEQLMDRRYRINKKAFNNPEAYQRIVA